MSKVSVFIVSLLLAFTTSAVEAQVNGGQAVNTNVQDNQIFYHTIERGQTVYAIATMYGVTVDDIIRLNPEARSGIKAGGVLKIPQRDATSATMGETEYTYHTIQPKETLYALSVKYKVLASDIMKANPGLSTSTFTIGKIIRIPATPPEILPSTELKTVTKEIDYTIARGETMYNITRRFGVTSSELLRLNPGLRRGVKAGMVIKIPVSAQETVTTTAPVQEERTVNALLAEPKRSERVDRIKVALLLPFMTDQVRPSDASTRVVEYYEGMLLAIDSLKKMGVSIELSVFDIGEGTRKMPSILQEDALRNANLIIGGVQNDQIKLIADFAGKNNIKYVIPFTSSNDDVLSNASLFQVNAPHSYLYAGAAQAGCDLFARDNIILVTIGDEQEKPDFIKAFKAEMQQRDITWKELKYTAESFAVDIQPMLDKTKRNIVVPTSSSLEAVNNIKTPLRMYGEARVTNPEPYQISLFGYPDWQTYTRDCLEDFYALNTYIYSNFYADNLRPSVQSFYTNYKNWYSKPLINIFPKYGILGFDTGMFFFDAIRRYGADFENSLDKIRYRSLQTGFQFERVNNWGGFINVNLFVVQYKNDNTVTRIELK